MDGDIMFEGAIEADSRFEHLQEEWDKICQHQLHDGTKIHLDGNTTLGKRPKED